jgi:hypothetical protein
MKTCVSSLSVLFSFPKKQNDVIEIEKGLFTSVRVYNKQARDENSREMCASACRPLRARIICARVYTNSSNTRGREEAFPLWG